jgi:hypothetical protein
MTQLQGQLQDGRHSWISFISSGKNPLTLLSFPLPLIVALAGSLHFVPMVAGVRARQICWSSGAKRSKLASSANHYSSAAREHHVDSTSATGTNPWLTPGRMSPLSQPG